MALKILMLLDNPFLLDLRVYREAKTLADAGHEVELYTTNETKIPEYEIQNGIRVHRVISDDVLDFKKQSYVNWLANELARLEFDVIHAHEHNMLNLGSQIKKLRPEIPLIYDSHELFHEQPTNLPNQKDLLTKAKTKVVRMIQNNKEKRFGIKYADYLITVNDSLAEILSKYFKMETPTVVIRNIPEYEDVEERSTILRDEFNIPTSTKILTFIGANIYTRTLNLEQIIDEFGNRENAALIFIAGKKAGRAALEQYVKDRKYTNIYFRNTVKPTDINYYLSSSDAGLVPTWNKKDLSYWLALDNKLFHYITAEIPVLSTQQPEYKKIVDAYKVGICVNPDTKDAYYNGFLEILKRKDEWGENIKKAKKILQWDNEKQVLIKFYEELETKIKN